MVDSEEESERKNLEKSKAPRSKTEQGAPGQDARELFGIAGVCFEG